MACAPFVFDFNTYMHASKRVCVCVSERVCVLKNSLGEGIYSERAACLPRPDRQTATLCGNSNNNNGLADGLIHVNNRPGF